MRKPFVVYQLPLLVWIACIFLLSSIPKIPVIQSPISLDKVVHFVVYGVLCWLSWRAFRHQQWLSSLQSRALLTAFLFTVVYGILDELHQLFVPGRTADVYDIAADALGGLFFVLWHTIGGKSDRGEETAKSAEAG